MALSERARSALAGLGRRGRRPRRMPPIGQLLSLSGRGVVDDERGGRNPAPSPASLRHRHAGPLEVQGLSTRTKRAHEGHDTPDIASDR